MRAAGIPLEPAMKNAQLQERPKQLLPVMQRRHDSDLEKHALVYHPLGGGTNQQRKGRKTVHYLAENVLNESRDAENKVTLTIATNRTNRKTRAK